MSREKNRAMFPEAARIVDELRAVFGPGVKLTWAQENGNEIGERGPDGHPVIVEYKPQQDVSEKHTLGRLF